MSADLFTEPAPPAKTKLATLCQGCARPAGGHYTTNCRQCSLRRMARGIPFAQSTKDKALTPAYRAQCAVLGDVKIVHAEVKAMAEALKANA